MAATNKCGKTRGHVKTEAEIGGMPPQAKEGMDPQKLEEARKDSPLGPSETVRPC